jgi:hypothetical protein
VATDSDLIKLVEMIAQTFRTVFSAARAFVMLKGSLFAAAVVATGAGLYVRGSVSTQHTVGTGTFEVALSEPSTLQVLAVVAVFVFTLIANLYCLNKNREHELRLRELELKAPPSLRKKLRPGTKKRNV